jgi:hypothetical protein
MLLLLIIPTPLLLEVVEAFPTMKLVMKMPLVVLVEVGGTASTLSRAGKASALSTKRVPAPHPE